MVEHPRRIGYNCSIKARVPGRTQESHYRPYRLPEANHTDSYEYRGNLKLFHFKDGSSHAFGVASYVSEFIDQYKALRKKQNLPEIQLNEKEVKVINLTPSEKKKLNHLLELDFCLSLDAIIDHPIEIFFNPIEIVQNKGNWKQWRKEIQDSQR